MKDFYKFNLYWYQPTNLNSSMNLQPSSQGLSGSIKTRHHGLTTYNNLECWNVLARHAPRNSLLLMVSVSVHWTIQSIERSSSSSSKKSHMLYKLSPLPFFYLFIFFNFLCGCPFRFIPKREEGLSLIQVAFLWLNWVNIFLGSKCFDFSWNPICKSLCVGIRGFI